MRPRFRSDLKCSREEQQGVVFYRVDDPKTQTSFRLYEIEYLIAQKLDGHRSLADVIKGVKDEYNFDISEPDLQKFVSQLESMGFVEKEGGEAAGGEKETQVMDRSAAPVEAEAESVSDADLLEQPSSAIDEAELKRLLKSALLHVRQGYIVHARDYFLAAKELSPADARLAKLVSHLEIIGDSSGPAEVDYLWNQAKELFPEIAEEVMPLADGKGVSPSLGEGTGPQAMAREDSLKSRLVWLALLVLLVLGGGGALWYFARVNHLFEGTAKASVAAIKSQRVPIYHDRPAESVRSARESWLQLAASGKVADVPVAAGARVQADQVLVSLALPPALEKQMAAAQSAVKKADGEYQKVLVRIDKAAKERESLEAEHEGDDAAGAKGKGKAKGDVKKGKPKAGKKAAALAKKEKALKADQAKAEKKLDEAKKKLEAIEAKVAQKQIRAPFAGLVVEVAVQKGQTVNKDQRALLLRDNLEARIAFVVADAGALAPGGEAFVSVARGLPSRGKVAAVQPADNGKRVEVTITDPAGAFVDMAPQEFRLVREFVDRAFSVPASALVSDARGSRVIVVVLEPQQAAAQSQGRALARAVEVMSKDAATAIIRDKSGSLRDGDHVVIDRIGADGGVASIVDGSFLDVQQN